MKQLLITFIVVLLTACGNTTNKSISHDEYQELLQQTIFTTPDTLMNKEQLALYIKIYDFMWEHIYVEDNCQKLSVGKDSMEKVGIPAIYYDVITYSIAETNEAVKEWIEADDEVSQILSQMDSLVKESKTDYWNNVRPELLKRLEAK
ncbi:MAG: hypothetical protein IIV19_02545 [Bacteroidaceae bacterium]|nr:hypothetical protein [Bacteroidaceae bacterium]